jgi:transcriptional regulator with XRE-family HTH domain
MLIKVKMTPARKRPPSSFIDLVAEKIKWLRLNKGLTLQELAKRTKISYSLISKVENRRVTPTLQTLEKISNALDTSIDYFFRMTEELKKEFFIVRSDGRKVSYIEKSSKDEPQYFVEPLSYGFMDAKIQPFLVSPIGKEGKVEPVTHHGQEFVFVLERSVLVSLGAEKIVLQKGDALYFNASLPHYLISMDEEPAKALHVMYFG